MAAVTLVQSVAGTPSLGSDTGSSTFGSNTTTGNTIVAALLCFSLAGSGAKTFQSISDGLNTYTLSAASFSSFASPNSSYDQIITQIAYCSGIIGATTPTVSATVTPPGTEEVFVTLLELTPSVFGNATSGSGNSTALTAGPLTPSQNGAYGVGSIGSAGTVFATGSPASGWSAIMSRNDGTNSVQAAIGQAQATAAPLTAEFDINNAQNYAASLGILIPTTTVTVTATSIQTENKTRNVRLERGNFLGLERR